MKRFALPFLTLVLVLLVLPLLAGASHQAAGVKDEVVKALEARLKVEKDEITRLYLAKGLTKLAPDNKDSTQELVKGFLSKNELINAEANKILGEVIQAGPAALVRALIPLLQHKDEVIRRQTAELLGKFDPRALSR